LVITPYFTLLQDTPESLPGKTPLVMDRKQGVDATFPFGSRRNSSRQIP
jgi:hypothetical protein